LISWNVSRNDVTLPYLTCSVVSLHSVVVYTCVEQANLVLCNRTVVVLDVSHPFMPRNVVLSYARNQDTSYRYVASIVGDIGGSIMS